MKTQDDKEALLSDARCMKGGDAWQDHPRFSRAEWRAEVSAGDTQRSYWDWVEAAIEALP